VINGGTLNIESPERYNAPARQLLDDIGIDLNAYLRQNQKNHGLYKSLGLGPAYFFDTETWGSDRLVKGGRSYESEPRGLTAEFMAQTPLNERARKDVRRLYDPQQPDYLPGLSSAEKKELLAKISYNDFLIKLAKVDPQVIWFLQTGPTGVLGVGTDATPALFWLTDGNAGFCCYEPRAHAQGRAGESSGWAAWAPTRGRKGHSLSRRQCHDCSIIGSRPHPRRRPGQDDGCRGAGQSELLTARSLRASSSNSPQQHGGQRFPRRGRSQASGVVASYVQSEKTYQVRGQVRGQACVMACWNMVIPYLVPSLPQKQKDALAFNVKAPIVYTSVAVRNWKAFQKLGVSHIEAPPMYHTSVSLTEAASLGGLQHPQNLDEPSFCTWCVRQIRPARRARNSIVWGAMICSVLRGKLLSATSANNWRALWSRADRSGK
jgi:spermidine dehydrogenase